MSEAGLGQPAEWSRGAVDLTSERSIPTDHTRGRSSRAVSRRTDELAVMVDTACKPLALTRQAAGLDDPKYPYSWLE